MVYLDRADHIDRTKKTLLFSLQLKLTIKAYSFPNGVLIQLQFTADSISIDTPKRFTHDYTPAEETLQLILYHVIVQNAAASSCLLQ